MGSLYYQEQTPSEISAEETVWFETLRGIQYRKYIVLSSAEQGIAL
jgi:hypothetical protein